MSTLPLKGGKKGKLSLQSVSHDGYYVNYYNLLNISKLRWPRFEILSHFGPKKGGKFPFFK